MKKAVLGIIIFWIAIFAVFILSNVFPLLAGTEVLLKTVPVDPRDLLRGDYVTLRYEISAPQNFKMDNLAPDSTIYVVLKVDKNKVATVNYISKEVPRNEFFIKGKVRHGWIGQIEYGIESYFVKEGTGRELERKLANGAFAKVVIGKNGKAKVKSLIIE